MDAFLRELRFAARRLRNAPGFAAVAVVTLAATLGLNAALFRLFDAVLLRQPEVASPETLLEVYSTEPDGPLAQMPMSFPDFEDLRRRSQSVAGAAAYAWFPIACELESGNQLLMGEIVSGEYFDVLGSRPLRGRLLRAEDDRRAADVAVLSSAAWHRLFAGDPAVIDREVRLNGRPFRIVGIAPPGFRGRSPAVGVDLWLPLRAAASLPTGVTIQLGRSTGTDPLRDRGRLWLWIVARLRAGASPTSAAGEIAQLGAEVSREHPSSNSRRAWLAVPASSVRVLPELDRALWSGAAVAIGLFALVLLVASANLATLVWVRGARRQRELAMRRVLGATRARLVGELAAEGALLALVGALLGLAVSWLLDAWLARLALPVDWPLTLALGRPLDLRQLGFVFTLTLAATLFFAGLPAMQISRLARAPALRSFVGPAGKGRARAQALLLVVQVAASTLLLTVAALLGRSLVQATHLSPGFDADRLAVLSLAPGLVGRDDAETEALFRRLSSAAEALPGVVSISQASHVPLSFAVNLATVTTEPPSTSDPGAWLASDYAAVDGAYFATMGIPLLEGRTLATEPGDIRSEVVINETLATALWPDGEAVGRRLRMAGREGPYEVVGVARDAKYRTLAEAPRPFLYRSLRLDPRGTRSLVVRSRGNPQALVLPLRDLMRQLDPEVPVRNAQTYDEILAGANLVPHLAALVSASFGALALLLVALGVFGVVSQLAAERRKELGIRLALGAHPATLVAWASRRGLLPLLVGWIAGAGGALATTRFLRSILFGIQPSDPASFGLAAIVLLAAGAFAALRPARRAVAADVVESLRAE